MGCPFRCDQHACLFPSGPNAFAAAVAWYMVRYPQPAFLGGPAITHQQLTGSAAAWHVTSIAPPHRLQVFRTYNASITLDTLLAEPSPEETVEGRKAEYDRANKEVGDVG